MKILRTILWALVYSLPAVLFFSYHPVISLGGDATMNFELSLPLIWLVIFDVLAILYLICLWFQNYQSSRRQKQSSPKNQQCQRSQQQQSCQHTSISLFNNSRTFPGISDRRFFLLSLFPFYLTLSILWSPNLLRGFLTAGIAWLIFIAVFSLLFIMPLAHPPRKFRTHILIIFFVATLLICKYCYAQSIMDILGLGRDVTWLCQGCTYRTFGFPHPSGFAIEPQYMGNLLLAPTLTALYLVVFKHQKSPKDLTDEFDHLETEAEQKLLFGRIHLPHLNWARWRNIGFCILAGFFSMTLFFTFSRGAIYAYAVALIVMFILAIKRHKFRWSLIVIPVTSFALSLSLQGIFAAVGPTAETFVSGVTKSIHQLSLGIIDLRPKTVENSSNSVDNQLQECGKNVQNSAIKVENSEQTVDKSEQNVDNSEQNCVNPVQKVDKTVEEVAKVVDNIVENHVEKFDQETVKLAEDTSFDGYVPESTNIRLQLNLIALKTWLRAPGHPYWGIALDCPQPRVSFDSGGCGTHLQFTSSSILFGVGLGGAGTTMHEAFPSEVTSPKEIVQNQPISLLLETGLVGVALAIFGLLIAFAPQIFPRRFLDGKAVLSGQVAGYIRDKVPKLPKQRKTSPTQRSKFISDRESLDVHPVERGINPNFWHHPAMPLLLPLIIAYLITLNFFSGLPNALQIYLMPPLLYLIFDSFAHPANSSQNIESQTDKLHNKPVK